MEKVGALPAPDFHKRVADVLREVLDSSTQEPQKKSRRIGLPRRRTQYRRAIITFIDILGFKNVIRSHSCAEVRHLLDRFRKELAPDEFDSEHLSLRFVRFSDCLVRAIFVPPDEPNGPDGLVFWELYGLLLAQMNLIWRGVVVRGAITVGDLYCEPGAIFGPGLVRAYELEGQALYPRILVDPNLLKELRTAPFRARDHGIREELRYIMNLISVDGEVPYLDYFKGITSNKDDDQQLFDFVERHRDLVQKGLKENKGKSAIIRKYRWMEQRHREFVRALPDKFVHVCGHKKRDLYV